MTVQDYSQDIKAIKKIQIFLKVRGIYNGKIDGDVKNILFDNDGKPENMNLVQVYQKIEVLKKKDQRLNHILTTMPEFSNLMAKYPDRQQEWEKRMDLYVDIDKKRDDISYSLYKNRKEEFNKTFTELQRELATNPNNEEFKTKKIKTAFIEWEGRNNPNGSLVGDPKYEYTLKDALAIVTNRTGLVEQLFGEKFKKTDDKLPSGETCEDIEKLENKEKIVSRFERFLHGFEQRYPQRKYKKHLSKIYRLLKEQKLSEAFSLFVREIQKDFRLLDLGKTIKTNEGLFEGLRSVRDYNNAKNIGIDIISRATKSENLDKFFGEIEEKREELVQQLKEKTEEFVQQSKEETEETESIENEVINLQGKIYFYNEILSIPIEAEKKAKKLYSKMVRVLEGDHRQYDFVQNEKSYIKSLSSLIFMEKTLEYYIIENGVEGLEPKEFVEMYKDMQGIGLWDLADSTKDLAPYAVTSIIVFIISWGLWSGLSSTASLIKRISTIFKRVFDIAKNGNTVINTISTGVYLTSSFMKGDFYKSFVSSINDTINKYGNFNYRGFYEKIKKISIATDASKALKDLIQQ